jgi:hypothetical protein
MDHAPPSQCKIPLPTAQTSFGPLPQAARAPNSLVETDHATPFQCRIPFPIPQTSFGPVPQKASTPMPTGRGKADHAAPFQWEIP